MSSHIYQQGNSRGHHRNAYTNGRHAYEYTERRPYKASYGHDDRESKLVYNEDGSINWEKTKGKKSHKMAASDTSGYFGGPGSNSFPLGDFTPNRQTYSDDYDDDDDYEDGYYDRRRSNYAGGIRLAGAVEDDGYTHAEGTFYDVETHIGTCGKQSQNSDKVCALNAEDMGEGGSENEKCGKSIEVVGPSGKTVTVTVVDSCKTCKAGGLDLSPAGKIKIQM